LIEEHPCRRLKPTVNKVLSLRDWVHCFGKHPSILAQEIQYALCLMSAACARGTVMLLKPETLAEPLLRKCLRENIDSLMGVHRHVWLLRNREGGLTDSVKRFERIRDELG